MKRDFDRVVKNKNKANCAAAPNRFTLKDDKITAYIFMLYLIQFNCGTYLNPGHEILP